MFLNLKSNKKKSFTLSEVIITIGIIGIVAALAIPILTNNINQAEFKVGIKKAVNSLNSAIFTNMSNNADSPYDNSDLYKYFSDNMNPMKKTTSLEFGIGHNRAFYTTDGIRYEFPKKEDDNDFKKVVLYENNLPLERIKTGKCGHKGIKNDDKDGSKNEPCLVVIDVNGDKKPNPVSSLSNTPYIFSYPNNNFIKDVYLILITDTSAIPYGITAQRAMYGQVSK